MFGTVLVNLDEPGGVEVPVGVKVSPVVGAAPAGTWTKSKAPICEGEQDSRRRETSRSIDYIFPLESKL